MPLTLRRSSASIRNIVSPTGTLTLNKLLPTPLPIHLHPSLSRSCRIVPKTPKVVPGLNISFLIMSAGFVNTVPATAAVTKTSG